MASSNKVSFLEANMLSEHSVTVANQRIYYAAYASEYQGDHKATYAQWLGAVDQYLRAIP